MERKAKKFDRNMTPKIKVSYFIWSQEREENDFKQRRKIINLSTKVKKFQNIKILKNIDWKALEVIEANKSDLPGLYLQKVPQRNYPYAKYFSHILGYTNKPSEKDLKLPFINDMLSLDIGKTGVEKISNNDLIGYPGKREIEVNAFGREIREISVKNSPLKRQTETIQHKTNAVVILRAQFCTSLHIGGNFFRAIF